MNKLKREFILEPKQVWLWSILGFQAGFINAYGFLSSGHYVSHLTGFGTQIGLEIGKQSIWYEIDLVSFPIAFILGSFMSGFFTSAREERGLKPLYDLIVSMLPVGMLLILMGSFFGIFGEFGGRLHSLRDFTLLYSLSFMCGMQNGCFATMTSGQIRTTHLTGIGTDMGTDFARIWFGNLPDQELKLVKKTNFSRIAVFFAFSIGSIVSVLATDSYQYYALLVPLLSSIYVLMKVIEFKKLDMLELA